MEWEGRGEQQTCMHTYVRVRVRVRFFFFVISGGVGVGDVVVISDEAGDSVLVPALTLLILCLNPFTTAVPFWGQIALEFLSGLSPTTRLEFAPKEFAGAGVEHACAAAAVGSYEWYSI